ncbi:MAG: LPS export ABC transporter periplasmic protein LptC, partial [Ignavibacteriae bacterium]|nr:LPS export ABC transporter periplasmic protein LptC [Ignavibacteriota bacterium]
ILVYSKKGFTLIDSGAVVDFYKDGEIASTLSGEKGKINDKTKDIEIYDSVHVISKDGSELKTQKLLWTNLTQRVSSDLFVSIKTPNETIEGIGFESDQNLKNYKIFKVSGTF